MAEQFDNTAPINPINAADKIIHNLENQKGQRGDPFNETSNDFKMKSRESFAHQVNEVCDKLKNDPHSKKEFLNQLSYDMNSPSVQLILGIAPGKEFKIVDDTKDAVHLKYSKGDNNISGLKIHGNGVIEEDNPIPKQTKLGDR